jgi:hypothetical protein
VWGSHTTKLNCFFCSQLCIAELHCRVWSRSTCHAYLLRSRRTAINDVDNPVSQADCYHSSGNEFQSVLPRQKCQEWNLCSMQPNFPPKFFLRFYISGWPWYWFITVITLCGITVNSLCVWLNIHNIVNCFRRNIWIFVMPIVGFLKKKVNLSQ